MIEGYVAEGGRLKALADPLSRLEAVIWLDMQSPTPQEEETVQTALGIDVPTREDMEEIEDSSRLYLEGNAVFMTAMLPSRMDRDDPIMAPVTFILTGSRLVTLRYHAPRAFQTFPTRAEKIALGCIDGETVLMALLDAVIDRLADILEYCGRDIDQISRGIFRTAPSAPGQRDFNGVLREIGRQADVVSNMLDSLVSVERLLAFVGPALGTKAKENRSRIKTLGRDTRFLTEHATFLSQKITFLLDATLGMINIDQNATIKIFSIAAVVFLPPTLIASIYGMNFEVMPELGWLLGYPFALGLMVASAFLSFWFFKRRGWL